MGFSGARVFPSSHFYSHPDSIESADTLSIIPILGQDNDSIPTDSIPYPIHIVEPETTKGSRINEAISNRNVRELLLLQPEIKIVSWKFNSTYLSLERIPVDTILWMNQLFYPQQDKYETYTFLGNLGSPSQFDHFFSREYALPFLFSRNYYHFGNQNINHSHFNVRRPFTILTYSTAGSRRQAEEVLRVLHTQNVNPHLNFGVEYNFFGTRGVYRSQETRNNAISLYSSYYKGNVSVQASFSNNSFKNQENGGLKDDYFIQDTLMESQLVPFWLPHAQSITRDRNFSVIAGYTFLNIRQFSLDTLSESQEMYIPLISTKVIVNNSHFSRIYNDNSPNDEYYTSFYINPNKTRDSVSLSTWETIAMLEIAQFARIPGMPGIRGWIGHEDANYYFFQPGDFLYKRDKKKYNNSHIGVGAYSQSPYLSYQGAMRIFASGYRAGDKQLAGQLKISLWKDSSMPQLKGNIMVDERTPDIFINSYFSNHHKWETNFNKEKRFLLSGALSAERWEVEVGYNLMHISDFIFFDQSANPSQADNVTITSAYLQKNIRLGGLNFFNRLVWQANTNTDVLSLPQLILFSALFYERELVKNALTAQLGANVYFRSQFYADAYSPALGQFYKQREKLLGNYPTLDIFANLKWKRVLIYLKYEHANQGFPNSQYFSALHYPMNPRIFKYGVSWTFYD